MTESMSKQDHDTQQESTVQETTTSSTKSNADENRSQTVLMTTKPTLRPTIIKIVLLLLVGLSGITLLTVVPSVAEAELTGVAQLGVGILLALGLIRYSVHLMVLRRTTYKLFPHGVRREFELFFRIKKREVLYRQIRSHEFNKSRIQSLLGYGSIMLNQGLGTLVLTDVPDPENVYERVCEEVSETSD